MWPGSFAYLFWSFYLQVQEALRQYNIQGVHPGLQAYLNQAVWLHMEGLLSQACKMASQRGDLSRSVPTLSSFLHDACTRLFCACAFAGLPPESNQVPGEAWTCQCT